LTFIGADDFAPLGDAGDVAISLLRGAGVTVLAVGLILAGDFDAGDGAGADATLEHQFVAGINFVIDAQGPQAGAFKHREIACLRGQTVIRRGNETGLSEGSAGARKTAKSGEPSKAGGPNAIHGHAGRGAGDEQILSNCLRECAGWTAGL